MADRSSRNGVFAVSRISRWLLVVALVAAACLVTACRSPQPVPASADAARDTIACAEPRPEICTQDYQPVCGLRDSGIRCVTTPCDSTEWKTYSNACAACSDSDVLRYRAGACDEDA